MRMDVPSWWPKRPRTLVRELAKTAASNAIQSVAKATLTAFGLPVAGEAAAGLLKETFVIVLGEASRVEKAIDPLISHPLLTGLGFLQDAANHAGDSADAIASRNDLLSRAHDWLRNARTRAMNSREDYVFVTAIDCLAVACHVGRESLALHTYVRMRQDLNLIASAAALLRGQANDELDNAHDFETWSEDVATLGKQGIILVRKRQRVRAEDLRRKADETERRLELLRALDTLALGVLERRNIGIDDAAIASALVDDWQSPTID